MEAQMERMQETHRNDIRVYLQRVVHLEYEHSNNLEAISTVADRVKAAELQEHQRTKALLQRARLHLKQEVEVEERQYEEEVQNEREKQKNQVEKMQERFEKDYRELEEVYEKRLEELKEELELRRKVELHEVEERRNTHINVLIWNHEAKFEEMRAYYNAITRDNLGLIQSLISRIEELRARQAKNEQEVDSLDRSNRQIKAPLDATEQQLKALAQKLQSYQKDKASLRQARARRAVLQRQVNETAERLRAMQAEYTETVRQRDLLYESFQGIVLAMQRDAGAKSSRLEKMLTELQDQYRVKNAQFGAVLRASNLDPTMLQNVTRKLDDVLTTKNEQIDMLRYETVKANKAHQDLVRMYEAKLKQFGIPSDGGLSAMADIIESEGLGGDGGIGSGSGGSGMTSAVAAGMANTVPAGLISG